MKHRSRSTLFLIELLIAIVVFAVCATVCINILVDSFTMATDGRDLRNALRAAENGAELYKASGGSAGDVAARLGGTVREEDGARIVVVFYNGDWQVCEESAASYSMRLICSEPDGAFAPHHGELAVLRITGEEITALAMAARERIG